MALILKESDVSSILTMADGPIRFGPDADELELERVRADCEQRLAALARAAERFFED